MLQALEGQTIVAKTGGANPNRSPERRKRYAANARRKPRKAGENVIWRRIKDNIDDLVLKIGANPDIATVLSRLVLYGHLTPEEGEIARYYAEVIARHGRFCASPPYTARAQVYDRASPGGIDEVERHQVNGTIREYEKRARRARKQHDRVEKVLQPYMHGRDVLDDVCLHDNEVNPAQYPSIKAMLNLIGAEFGIGVPKTPNKPKQASKSDVRLVAESACETLEAVAKRHRMRIVGFSVKSGSDKSMRSLIVHGPQITDKLSLKLKLYKMLPEALEAALLKACEAKGWKEIV